MLSAKCLLFYLVFHEVLVLFLTWSQPLSLVLVVVLIRSRLRHDLVSVKVVFTTIPGTSQDLRHIVTGVHPGDEGC